MEDNIVSAILSSYKTNPDSLTNVLRSIRGQRRNPVEPFTVDPIQISPRQEESVSMPAFSGRMSGQTYMDTLPVSAVNPASNNPTPGALGGVGGAVSAGMSLGAINPLIKKYFPQSEWINAQRVMMGESGGRANAVGDNFPIRGQTIPSYGLFQIRALPGRPSPAQLQDPELNVRYAAEMQKKQGWRPWTAARKLGIVK